MHSPDLLRPGKDVFHKCELPQGCSELLKPPWHIGKNLKICWKSPNLQNIKKSWKIKIFRFSKSCSKLFLGGSYALPRSLTVRKRCFYRCVLPQGCSEPLKPPWNIGKNLKFRWKSTKICKISKISWKTRFWIFQKLLQSVSTRFLCTPLVSYGPEKIFSIGVSFHN